MASTNNLHFCQTYENRCSLCISRFMKKLNRIYHIADLAAHYDALFFDVWGVLVLDGANQGRVEEELVATMNNLIAAKPVYFVSNYSSSSDLLVNKLQQFGIKVSPENVVTAGDLSNALLCDHRLLKELLLPQMQESREVTFYHLGSEADCLLPYELKLNCTKDVARADLLLISLGVKHPMQCDERIFEILENAHEAGIPALCVNPDKHFNCKVEGDRYCAGYFATIFQSMGGKVHFIGKPYKEIFLYTLKKAGLDTSKNKVLMVGDSLGTDILGGKSSGLDTALVTTGNAGLGVRSRASDEVIVSQLLLYCQLHNIYPEYIVRL